VSVLVAGTNAVNLDEPCMGLYELNEQSPGSRGFRRYQIILVVRGGGVAEFRRDLGPARLFKADQFRIPGGVRDERTGRFESCHRVGELVDVADALRDGRFAREPAAPVDLVAGYHDEMDRRARRRRKVSQFGRLHKTQRD
jgi:hypothetical protein